jgi:TatD DNase family protein
VSEPLVDIGVNLADSAFASDLVEVIERARDAHVMQMVVTGTSVESSLRAQSLCEEHSGLWATAGVHPHHAKDCNGNTLAALRRLAAAESCAAIGECGLDYNRDFSPRPVQRKWFEAQVELACDLAMPLFLHERDAADDLIKIIKRHRQHIEKAVVHCFTGSVEVLDRYLELDLYIGITGWICDERRGLELQQSVAKIPENRLMIETDAPYLLPRTIRPRPKSRRNEPANLPHVLQTLAECVDRPVEEVARAATQTAREFFGLPESLK